MRDAYTQLRRSAYDAGSVATPTDDFGGLRIKSPRTPSTPSGGFHARGQSREVTLLENGMIVEHVDVRKEEKEARERKRKEDKRARKSSRNSGADVTSLYSVQSVSGPTDGGVGLRPFSRYSPPASTRPSSVLTNPLERPNLPHAYSQASFSDVHSLGSPRRSRFFGMKNLSPGWRSQDSLAPSGMSGSMVDMQYVYKLMVCSETLNIKSCLVLHSNVNQCTHDQLAQRRFGRARSGLQENWRSYFKNPTRSPRKSKAGSRKSGVLSQGRQKLI
jgi:hypothetical protein